MRTTLTRPTNVAAHLPRVACERPDGLAVAVAKPGGGYARLTSRELDRLSDRAAFGLRAAGIDAGTRTVLMVPPGVEFIALVFALFKLGAVPVLVDPGMGLANLRTCLDEAEPAAFVGSAKAHAARRLFGWARRTVQTRVTVGPRWFPGGRSYAKLIAAAPDREFATHDPEPKETAAILFTSGSTGVPKGVVYTHETFDAQIRSLRETYGIAPGEVDLATFPLFALFGPALGMAAVVPRMDASRPAAADPQNLVTAIHDLGCTSVFASPALVDRIGRHCEATGSHLPSVRRVLSAGAPATNAALERLAAHLAAGAQVFTPYGATEALPVTSIGSDEILGETRAASARGAGVCVGRPVPGVDVAIIGITDTPIAAWSADLPLPAGEIGEIVVRGPVVTESYLRRPESTALAKIRDGDRVRHRMGDVGYLDDAGRLWMCGRKSHRVETADGTLFTIPCEAIFDAHPAVRRTALVGVTRGTGRGDSARGTGRGDETEPVLCVELEPGHVAGAGLTAELLELGRSSDLTRRITTIHYHPRFPVDVRHNAKILRERLAAWAATR